MRELIDLSNQHQIKLLILFDTDYSLAGDEFIHAVRHFEPCDRIVQLAHIGVVMFSVMDFHGSSIDVRLKRIMRVGQIGQRISHLVLLRFRHLFDLIVRPHAEMPERVMVNAKSAQHTASIIG